MADRRIVRVAEGESRAFQLRKGEDGISVFDLTAISPALTESEVLETFRGNSHLVERTVAEIEARGLIIVMVEGADPLPMRLRLAHAEIRPGAGMTRSEFKQSLKELE